MGFGFASYSFLLYVMLVLQYGYEISAQTITNDRRMPIEKDVDDSHKITNMKPYYNIWFTPKDLYKGFKMPIFFAKRDPANTPHLLSREEADSIPFSVPQLDNLLKRFSIPKHSPQGIAMAYTLYNCDYHRSCVSSLESMLDLVQKFYGPNTKFDVYTSVSHTSENSPPLQNYTFLESPYQFPTKKIVTCHPMPYPYAIYFCHGHSDGSTKVYKILIGTENGDRIDAMAVCHMKTNNYDEDHVSFKMLHMKPKSGPVCHFIPRNNYVWLPSMSDQ